MLNNQSSSVTKFYPTMSDTDCITFKVYKNLKLKKATFKNASIHKNNQCFEIVCKTHTLCYGPTTFCKDQI